MEKWKYIAGAGQTARQHSDARAAVWDREDMRLAYLVPEEDRTPKEKDAILKVEDPVQYRKNHAGNSNKKLPDVSWRPDLSEEERTETWKYAAGLNVNGTSKTAAEHGTAREKFRREAAKALKAEQLNGKVLTDPEEAALDAEEARLEKDVANCRRARETREALLEAIEAKKLKGIKLTDADIATQDEEEARLEKKRDNGRAWLEIPENREKNRATSAAWLEIPGNREKCRASSAAWLEIPENREKNRVNCAAYRARIRMEKMEAAHTFIQLHGLELGGDKPLTDEAAFDEAYNIFHDKESTMGKVLFEALGGMTPREAFWDGKSRDLAMYVSAARGDGGAGKSNAEGIRFLVKNGKNTTVLTHMDGKDFKYGDRAFKNLELVYCPVYVSRSYADCTKVESALQLLFNFLEVGSKRLWLRSGVGRFHRPLRSCDMKFIENPERDAKDMNLSFMCGITILKNVEVLARNTDSDSGKDIVTSIRAGLGTTCNVNQPKRGKPVCSVEQKTALVSTLKRLGPNFMDLNRKRKAMVVDEQDTTTTQEDDCGVEVYDTDSDSDSEDCDMVTGSNEEELSSDSVSASDGN
jgi:hypothetical protein